MGILNENQKYIGIGLIIGKGKVRDLDSGEQEPLELSRGQKAAVFREEGKYYIMRSPFSGNAIKVPKNKIKFLARAKMSTSQLKEVSVDTIKYQGVHGKKPKGTGWWIFDINGERFEVQNASYSDAVKKAKAHARKKKAYSISVLGESSRKSISNLKEAFQVANSRIDFEEDDLKGYPKAVYRMLDQVFKLIFVDGYQESYGDHLRFVIKAKLRDSEIAITKEVASKMINLFANRYNLTMSLRKDWTLNIVFEIGKSSNQ